MATQPPRVQSSAPPSEGHDEVLSPGALELVGRLHGELDDTRRRLLAAREERQAELDAGGTLEFVTAPEDFTVAPVPDALQDRRVEITGPTSRKMVINALNSGARAFMADFEDANSPTWANMVGGQANLADAVRGTIEHEEEGKQLPARRGARGAARAPARAAPARAPPARGRRAGGRRLHGLRPVHAPQRRRSCSSAAPARTSTSRSSSRTARRASGATPS